MIGLRTIPGFLLAAGVLWAGGCSRPYDATVSGTVNFGGEPLERGTVTFHPQHGGVPAYGAIQPGGTYTVSTAGRRGLQAGDYSVTVVALEPTVVPPSGDMPSPGRSIVPASYGTVQTSGLRFSVSPGANRIDVQLR